MIKPIATALICIVASFSTVKASVSDLLTAMRHVEVQGAGDNDSGKARGPYQIHVEYWQDAVDFDTTIGGTYEDCDNEEYATKIVMAYLRRYGPKALAAENYEVLSRIHNGGPSGAKKDTTIKYWLKVKAELDRHNGK